MVVNVPFTVTVPLAKLNIPLAILFEELPIRLVIVRLPEIVIFAKVDVKV